MEIKFEQAKKKKIYVTSKLIIPKNASQKSIKKKGKRNKLYL